MGFFSNLFGGKDNIKAANQAADAASAYANAGYSQATDAANKGYTSAVGRISPYESQGRAGYNAYADSTGVNGASGYDRAKTMFDGDPFRAGTQDAAARGLKDIFRRYNSQGMGNSGASGAAVQRGAADRYAADVEQFRSRLAGLGQQGGQFATQLAGLDQQNGQTNADYAIGRNSALANIENNRLGQITAARNQAQGNVMSTVGQVAGLAMAGFAPGAGGASAFGNMAKAFGGGSSSNGLTGSYGTYGQSWQPVVR